MECWTSVLCLWSPYQLMIKSVKIHQIFITSSQRINKTIVSESKRQRHGAGRVPPLAHIIAEFVLIPSAPIVPPGEMILRKNVDFLGDRRRR
ncbi:unnamed protein product, partial [Trichogramma brassicae]